MKLFLRPYLVGYPFFSSFLRPQIGAARFTWLPAKWPQIVVICALALLVFAGQAQAQEPTPTPNFDNPYDFQPVDYESGEDNPALTGLGEMIASVSFINQFGSVAVTVWSILDGFAGGGVLGYLVIILLGVVIIKWIAGFVYSKPITEKLDASAAADVAGDIDPELGRKAKKFVTFMKKRPRF